MAVISIRFNEDEEEILNYLTEFFEKDRSSLIKQSLTELYEDLKDREVIDMYEKSETKRGKTKFLSSDDILKQIT